MLPLCNSCHSCDCSVLALVTLRSGGGSGLLGCWVHRAPGELSLAVEVGVAPRELGRHRSPMNPPMSSPSPCHP